MNRDELYNIILSDERCKTLIDGGAFIVKENYYKNNYWSDLTLYLEDKKFNDWCYFMRVTYSPATNHQDEHLVVQCIDMPKFLDISVK